MNGLISYSLYEAPSMFGSLPMAWSIMFLLGLITGSALYGQATAVAGPQSKAPVSSNEQAHALLESARLVNGLFSDDLKPWHLTATVTQLWNNPKPVPGTVEVWAASQYRWRAVDDRQNKRSTTWSLSRGQQLNSHEFSTDPWEPFSNPLRTAGFLEPGIELQLKQISMGVVLDCMSVVHPEQYKMHFDQDYFPSLCFDKSRRLRLLSYGEMVSQYDSYRDFQGHSVAGHVKISTHGNPLIECTLTSLDALDPIDESVWKPEADAIHEAYALAPGDSDPVLLHSQAGSTYINAEQVDPTLLILVPAVVGKDGTVSVAKNARIGTRRVKSQVLMLGSTANAISANFYSASKWEPIIAAARRWKFAPYLIDGEAVEVSLSIPFTNDGRPWGQK